MFNRSSRLTLVRSCSACAPPQTATKSMGPTRQNLLNANRIYTSFQSVGHHYATSCRPKDQQRRIEMPWLPPIDEGSQVTGMQTVCHIETAGTKAIISAIFGSKAHLGRSPAFSTLSSN